MAIFDTKHQRAAWLVAILGLIIVIAMVPYASGILAVPILYVAVAPLCDFSSCSVPQSVLFDFIPPASPSCSSRERPKAFA